MNYQTIISNYIESKYLINMTSVEKLVRTGCALGLNEDSLVLDLCCGYGEWLKIWSEAFGIHGTGVDVCKEFIDAGKVRLMASGIGQVRLVHDDVYKYSDDLSYDVVCCTESLGEIDETFGLMGKFLKPRGKLVACKTFSRYPNPPQELTDFDGPLFTLDELYGIYRELGYYIVHLESDSNEEWERYITWSANRDIERLRKNKDDTALAVWIDKWFHIYFGYRREYEGQALFVLEKL